MIGALYKRAAAEKFAANERIIRQLLEHWVSGLEPAVVFQRGEIVGLCDANAQIGDTLFVMVMR